MKVHLTEEENLVVEQMRTDAKIEQPSIDLFIACFRDAFIECVPKDNNKQNDRHLQRMRFAYKVARQKYPNIDKALSDAQEWEQNTSRWWTLPFPEFKNTDNEIWRKIQEIPEFLISLNNRDRRSNHRTIRIFADEVQQRLCNDSIDLDSVSKQKLFDLLEQIKTTYKSKIDKIHSFGL
jgi:hypothetical protein